MWDDGSTNAVPLRPRLSARSRFANAALRAARQCVPVHAASNTRRQPSTRYHTASPASLVPQIRFEIQAPYSHPSRPVNTNSPSATPNMALDIDSPLESDAAKEYDYKSRCEELEAALNETRSALDEFQMSSRELETELEKELENMERQYKDAKRQKERLKMESDDWKVALFECR